MKKIENRTFYNGSWGHELTAFLTNETQTLSFLVRLQWGVNGHFPKNTPEILSQEKRPSRVPNLMALR